MERLIVLLVLFCSIHIGASPLAPLNCVKDNKQDSSKGHWYNVDKPEGYFVVVHGLNSLPEIMGPLVKWLNQQKYSVYNVTLTGHHKSFHAFKTVEPNDWVRDVKHGYCVVRFRAYQEQKKPIYFLGYSLGALSTSALLQQEPGIDFEKLVFFAPPYKLKTYTGLVKSLFWWETFTLPSLANVGGYRAHWGVPMKAYKSLFELKDQFLAGNTSSLKRRPGLVFLHPKDELVDYEDTKRWMEKERLTNWTVIDVDNRGHSLKKTYAHMMTEEKFMSPNEWRRILSSMGQFLKD